MHPEAMSSPRNASTVMHRIPFRPPVILKVILQDQIVVAMTAEKIAVIVSETIAVTGILPGKVPFERINYLSRY
jgi:hypothetical protein